MMSSVRLQQRFGSFYGMDRGVAVLIRNFFFFCFISFSARTAWFSMRAKMTLSICVSVALAVVWLMRFLLAR